MARILSMLLVVLALVSTSGLPALAMAGSRCCTVCEDDCADEVDGAVEHDESSATSDGHVDRAEDAPCSGEGPACPPTCASCSCGCCIRAAVVTAHALTPACSIAEPLGPLPRSAGRVGTTSHARVFRPPRHLA